MKKVWRRISRNGRQVWMAGLVLLGMAGLTGLSEAAARPPAGDTLRAVGGMVSVVGETEGTGGRNPDTLREVTGPQVILTGKRDGLFRDAPGSVSYLGPAQLRRMAPLSGNDIFKAIPGLHVVDEEGAGLRMNLSVRGMNPDRSRGVLVLEDGIPVALNPYGEPEMYYTPAMERMEGVEVVKGSGQIMYGPQTVGGVVNYLSAPIPSDSLLRIRLGAGGGGLFNGQLSVGRSKGDNGYRVDFLRKRAERLGHVGFVLSDLTAKWRIRTGPRAEVLAKWGVYDERSDATYIGLTQPMYESGTDDFVRMSPDDRLEIRRYHASVVHTRRGRGGLTWKNQFYGYTTQRNWQRQDFSFEAGSSGRTGIVWGDEGQPGGAVYMLDRNGHRNRGFAVAGANTRLSGSFATGGWVHRFDAGWGYLWEQAEERRVNGSKAAARSGQLVEDEVRSGQAVHLYLQDKVAVSDRLQVSAGIRAEHYDYERNILRNKFAGVVVDTHLTAGRSVGQLIPGMGFNYRPADGVNLFGGLHRGFAPPRTKDAVTQVGKALDLAPELSWNTELGVRGKASPWLSWALTGFRMDFSNQIIPVAESAGGTGAGLVNGGRTRHQGLEAELAVRLSALLPEGYLLQAMFNSTYVRATFSGDRYLAQGLERANVRGNRTPYAPAWLANGNLVLQWPGGSGGQIQARYTDTQFADELNTVTPSANGRTGRIPGFFTLDLNTWYALSGRHRCRLNLAVRNLTNERYIVSRRPQGIRVGLPRYVSIGIVWER
ncbi:MAG: hypothetical protein RLY31_433 [Bacteroidota bacterium]